MYLSVPLFCHFLLIMITLQGTMNWAPMIRPMLPSSMTAVVLRTLRLLAALPLFMSLMMKTDVISLTHLLPSIGQSTAILVSFSQFYYLYIISKFYNYTLLCINWKFYDHVSLVIFQLHVFTVYDFHTFLDSWDYSQISPMGWEWIWEHYHAFYALGGVKKLW